MKTDRVIAYIDGFNLYFGLREKTWRCYYWLDVHALCKNILKPGQRLMSVKYFTSHITKSTPDKRKRQSTYLEVLKGMDGVKLFYGKYQWNPVDCRQCGSRWETPQEKMTDVQIASEMVADAHKDSYDTALLVTGDIDLVPSVERVKADFPHKRVVVVFPPMRATDELRGVCDGYTHITESILEKSQLPKTVTKAGGYKLRRPSEWK